MSTARAQDFTRQDSARQDLALLDAGGANLGSVRYALERLGVQARLVRDGDEFGTPDRVLLPGVGAAGTAMALLHARGLVEPLRACTVPLLGICLGMQLLFESSAEGEVACLGLVPGRVTRLPALPGLRVPHMGWNGVQIERESTLLDGVSAAAEVYFVHAYAAPVTAACVASCSHGARFAAIVEQGHVAGFQFHPERSAAAGARLLGNFLRWRPRP